MARYVIAPFPLAVHFASCTWRHGAHYSETSDFPGHNASRELTSAPVNLLRTNSQPNFPQRAGALSIDRKFVTRTESSELHLYALISTT
jgi:hypothetical protein